MLPRLYAILDIDLCRARDREPLAVLDAWLGAGVRLVQLRAKSLAGGPMLALAHIVAARTREAGAIFVVNDRADVARLVGADGVHLGQDDLSPADARTIVPVPAIVGLSTHGEAQVRAALETPVSYLAIGPVFSTASKANPEPVVGLEGVRLASDLARGLPVVAIGGITLARAADVLRAGAASVAVISDLVHGDAHARARAWLDVVGTIH